MHRFRKKSDAKRPSQSAAQPAATPQQSSLLPAAVPRQRVREPLELLPPDSDFRTSLILPDLSRRFSLLRQADGRPIDLQDVREKLAAQRVQGSTHAIAEDEEEYVINYLSNAGHIPGGVVDDRGTDDRSPHSIASKFAGRSVGSPASSTNFPRSEAVTSPVTPSSSRSRTSNTSSSSKRHSNNMFGSGGLKDQSYFRSVATKRSSEKSLRSMASHHTAPHSSETASPNGAYANGRGPHHAAQEVLDEEAEEDAQEIQSIGQALSPSEGDAASGRDALSDDGSRPSTPLNDHVLAPIMPLSPRSPLRSSLARQSTTTPIASPPSSPLPARTRRGGPPLFSPSQIRRASLALEEVIRNFEEDVDAEEEILTPRTPSGGFNVNGGGSRLVTHPWTKQLPSVHAISGDDKVGENTGSPKSTFDLPHFSYGGSSRAGGDSQNGASPSPTAPVHSPTRSVVPLSPRQHPTSPGGRAKARVPGYIPGMHRPITPKDAESEDFSSTPRALSPSSPVSSYHAMGAVSSQRGASTSSITMARPTIATRASAASPTSPSIYSPYSPAARANSRGGSTPTQSSQLVSTWSPATASPTSPQVPAAFTMPSRAAMDDFTFGRRDTKMSTSSSSVLPASTSSSSLASLTSPYLSDSGTTPFTSDMQPPSTPSTTGDASPHVWTFPKRKQPPASGLATSPAANPPYSSGAIVMASSMLPQGSGSRPDTPLGQMYTGSYGQAIPYTQAADDTSSRSPHYTNGFPQAPSPKLERNWSETRRALSPAIPESPFIHGAGGVGTRDTNGTRASPTNSHARQDSTVSLMELAAAIAEETPSKIPVSARSPTPSSRGARSPTPVNTATSARSPTFGPQATTSVSQMRANGRVSHSHQRSQSSDLLNDDEDRTVTVAGKPRRSTSFHRPGSTRSPPPKPILIHNPSSSLASVSQLSDMSFRGGTPSMNPLVLQPHFNSSRSSLSSAGSSFHSSDRDDSMATLLKAFSPSADQTRRGDGEDSPTESDHEDLLGCWGGVTKKDLQVIHEKLVVMASAASSGPPVSMSPSSQSRVARSPPPGKRRGSDFSMRSLGREQEPTPASPPSSSRKNNSSKADALLKSMLESLPAPQEDQPSFMPSLSSSVPPTPIEPQADSSSTIPRGAPLLSVSVSQSHRVAPPKRSPIPSFDDPDTRKKALTEALFGDTSPGGDSTVSPDDRSHPFSKQNDLTLQDLEPIGRTTPAPLALKSADDQLIADVTRLNAAATEALKSPTLTRADSLLKRQGTKRIKAKLISGPQLVSSTTSVDNIPLLAQAAQSSISLTNGSLMPPAERQASKLSLRIKKLREKLKTKSSFPNGEEITPWQYDGRSPSPSSSNHAASSNLSQTVLDITFQRSPSPAPATTVTTAPADIKTFRFPSPVPPATSPLPQMPHSAGIKGLMSRFRSNSRKDLSEQSSMASFTDGKPVSRSQSRNGNVVSPISPNTTISAADSQPKEAQRTSTANGSTSNVIDLQSPREETDALRFDLSTPPPEAVPDEPEDPAVKQLFDAASNLGLDKAALNELLVRSTSSASRSTGWTNMTRSNSLNTPATTAYNSGRDSGKLLPSDSLKRAVSTRTQGALSRVPEQRSSPTPNAGQVVVRRTIIFPSEAEQGLMRKASTATKPSKKKNRMSSQSTQSSRSLLDRVPTPPPNRISRRFSKEPSPPMPSIPPSVPSNVRESVAGGAAGFGHKSQHSAGSAYGSLFDMYGEPEPAASSMNQSVSSAGMPTTEAGQALEVVELSNGEVIWSVVDAMRDDLGLDDDASSVYQSRMSMTSDYSAKSPEAKDDVQVFFREHKRMGSKGSATSNMSRKKVFAANGTRPETKVFFSSASHIGRLIEAMSRGAEAGSFDFLPAPPESSVHGGTTPSSFQSSTASGHSPAVSMTDNTVSVEDRLEHLLKLTSRAL